jgi:NAD(P)-dependent dehydrogenase (short-subunit alcohol dehydrogenase family)
VASVEKARKELGDDVIVFQSDAGDVAEQKAVVDQITKFFGRLDILFGNAGVAKFGSVESSSEADFDKSFATNVKGPYFLIQALLPIFAKGASIVLNTSINAHIGMLNSSVYSLTKGALLTLAKTRTGRQRHSRQCCQPRSYSHPAI